MARPMRADGTPYPRQRPINWEQTRRILRWRQADKRIRDQGFVKIYAFSSLPWESPDFTHRIVDTAIHPDGMTLYVKTELRGRN